MSIDVPVAASFPSWIRDTAFPRPSTLNAGTANVGASSPPAYDRWRGQANPVFLATLTGDLQPQWIIHRGIPGIRMVPTGANRSGQFFGENLLINASLNTRLEFAKNAQQTRVWIDEFYLASDVAPAMNRDTEVMYAPVSGANFPALGAASNQSRFGIRSNGAGNGWEWVSFRALALQETVALAWPASTLDQWVKVQFVLTDATATSDSNVRLLLNNTLVLSRSWGVGSVLPAYSDSVDAQPYHIRRIIRAGTLSGPTVYAARFRSRAGVFDQAGVELPG